MRNLHIFKSLHIVHIFVCKYVIRNGVAYLCIILHMYGHLCIYVQICPYATQCIYMHKNKYK